MYNFGGIIEQSKDFDSYVERYNFLQNQLAKAKAHFDTKKNDIEPNKTLTVQLGNDQTKPFSNFPIQSNPKKETHATIFKNDLNAFETALKSELSRIDDFVLIEQIVLEYKNKPQPEQLAYLYKCKHNFKTDIDVNHALNNENYTYNPKPDKWGLKLVKRIIKELKHPRKPQPSNITKKLSLNPNFDDPQAQIKTIHENSKTLFNATLEQWQNLFSENIQPFDKPIELAKGISKADLRVFIDDLKYHGFIRTGSFLKVLQQVNAFSINGKTLTAHDYKTANNGKNYPNTRNCDKVKEVFKALKVED